MHKNIIGTNAVQSSNTRQVHSSTKESDVQGPKPALEQAVAALTRNRSRSSRIHVWPPKLSDLLSSTVPSSSAAHTLVVSLPSMLDSARECISIGDGVVVAGRVPAGSELCRIIRRLPAWGANSVWFVPQNAVPEECMPQENISHEVAIDEVLRDSFDACVRSDCAEEESLSLMVKEFFGLLAERLGGDGGREDPEWVCITCSDEGRLGEIQEPHPETFSALARTACGEEEIDVTLVGDVEPGDMVLIHARGAIARIADLNE